MHSPETEVEGTQPYYRAILVDMSGREVSAYRIMASEDDEAVEQAKALLDGYSVDLWDGLRFIEHYPAVDPR